MHVQCPTPELHPGPRVTQVDLRRRREKEAERAGEDTFMHKCQAPEEVLGSEENQWQGLHFQPKEWASGSFSFFLGFCLESVDSWEAANNISAFLFPSL